MIFLLVALMLMTAVAVCLFVKIRRHATDGHRLRVMMEHMNTYAFLIDESFDVKETNYYALNPGQSNQQPQVLGNVLHCKTACDTGLCGSGEACNDCPVRFVIKKSFEQKRDFSGLEVGMELYADGTTAQDVDVNVGGRYVVVDNEPCMVLNVKNVTERRRFMRHYMYEPVEDGRPKLMLATQSLLFHERVMSLLSGQCHVFLMESREQVLNRIGQSKDHGFCALLTDETFEHSFHVIESVNQDLPVLLLASQPPALMHRLLEVIPENVSDEVLKERILSVLRK